MRAIPYGTRGSYSVPSDEGFSTIKYGGSTTCWAIENQNKKTGKVGIVRSRWVSRIFYVDDLALLEITFAPDVVPLITRLEEHFTKYEAKQVAHLTSKYATRLYELLIAWREVGKTPIFELQKLRKNLGVEDDEYQRMHHFKSRVLETAITQINEHTDIKATYEQHKQGRTITGFSFKFKQKPQAKIEKTIAHKRDPNTIDIFTNITDAQIAKYSTILCKLGSISDLSNFPDYPSFANWIAKILKAPESANPAHAKRVFKALRTETDFFSKRS
jgi:hypothetical protein